jgi:hypothetical protein
MDREAYDITSNFHGASAGRKRRDVTPFKEPALLR